MRNATRREALGLLGLAGLVPVAGRLLTTPAAAAAMTSSARDKIRRRHFPNVSLQTQDGKWVRFYDDLVNDKIVTINFFYAKCDGICPTVTANLAQVQRILGARVGREIFMNSISLKPEQDSPAALKEYAEMFHAKPGWSFLTGKPEAATAQRWCRGVQAVLQKGPYGRITYQNDDWAEGRGLSAPP